MKIMGKIKTSFVCQKCNYSSPKWLGQCPECLKWNTLVESMTQTSSLSRKASFSKIKPFAISDLKKRPLPKMASGIKELDQVLGGGLVLGQVILFAGEPGIGKSTLLTQLALKLVPQTKSKAIYYVCGEESPQQVGLRLARLKGKTLAQKGLLLLPETNIDQIIGFLSSAIPSPYLVIIDSIQTLTTPELSGMAGSVGQVRESAQRLISWAKKNQVPTLLVGHMTKQGSIAGPKVLEHAVDTVIYFEGERLSDLRLLRTSKNRFGPTDEVGLFKMTSSGLLPVDQNLLIQNLTKPQIGSALSVVSEGTRLMMVEIQALVTQSFTPMAKRVITGLSKPRAEMLIAVVQKQLNLPLFKYDIFLNVAGGLKIKEPGADLAVCAALFSSYKNKPLPASSCFWGEVSLLGQVSSISQDQNRRKNAKGLRIKQIYTNRNLPNIGYLRKLL